MFLWHLVLEEFFSSSFVFHVS
uniref:Uncharacterized protein n=1 Tax=Arabidopsis thaliana TaxID=3702 RepID=Q0WRA2_ARATH|nr:hypothetical protein [Arabidopsis thaliana]